MHERVLDVVRHGVGFAGAGRAAAGARAWQGVGACCCAVWRGKGVGVGVGVSASMIALNLCKYDVEDVDVGKGGARPNQVCELCVRVRVFAAVHLSAWPVALQPVLDPSDAEQGRSVRPLSCKASVPIWIPSMHAASVMEMHVTEPSSGPGHASVCLYLW